MIGHSSPCRPQTVHRAEKAVACVFLFLLCGTVVAAEPASYRTGKPEPRIAQVPAEIQRTIFTQPEATIEPLVRWLVGDVRDDFLKVKVVHDWIADNIDYDAENYLSGGSPEPSWQATLTRRKAFCQGYSQLLEKMCRLAGIDCEVVPGYGRGFGFQIGQVERVEKSNHAWNAVKILGRWYQVDVCWDAGHLEGRSYHKQYDTCYLFPEPRHFLHTHFPTGAKWQLLDKPLSPAEFASLPLLEGRFFANGLRLTTHLRRLEPVGESVQFSVAVPENTVVMAILSESGKDASDKWKGRTLVRRTRNEANILVTFPQAGSWGVRLLTKPRQDEGSYWQAAVLEFAASAGTAHAFPKTFGSMGGMDCFLENPLFEPLAADTDHRFKIRVRNAQQVQLLIGQGKWVPMQRAANDPELYEATAAVPAGSSARIMALPPRGGGNYWALIEFTAH